MSMPPSSLNNSTSAWIVGIDLAWGEKERDALCLIQATRESSSVLKTARTFGDDELLAWLAQHAPSSDHALLSIDAPLIIPNATGCRPVERQISSEFGKYHAYCHSSNSTKPNCARPLRVARLLRENRFIIGFDLNKAARMTIEVYPHPAMILLFELERIIKYKKGLWKQRDRSSNGFRSLYVSASIPIFPNSSVLHKFKLFSTRLGLSQSKIRLMPSFAHLLATFIGETTATCVVSSDRSKKVSSFCLPDIAMDLF